MQMHCQEDYAQRIVRSCLEGKDASVLQTTVVSENWSLHIITED